MVYPDGLEVLRTHAADGALLSLERDEPGGGPDPTLGYLHDSRGRPWRVEQPDGSVVESLYDERGFRTRVTVWSEEPPPLGSGTQLHRLDFTADARGRLSAVTEVDGDEMTDDPTVRYRYDSRGRIDRIEYFPSPAAVTPELTADHEWEDDPRPRLTRLHWFAEGPTTIADIRYRLDDAGHRTDLTHSGSIGQRTIHYSFDATYRLEMETHRDGASPETGSNLLQVEYQYDPVGNRTRRIDRSGTPWSVDSDTISTHDDNDRLTSAGVSTYTWDARGRLTGESDGLETLVHSWSGDDRLLSVTGGAAEVTYSYDGEQRLIGRQEGAEPAASFIVDSGFRYAQALVEYTGTLGAGATIEARHVFGQRLLGERRAELQWAVTDALGSVRGLYDADAGTPFEGPWEYEAFGPHLNGTPGAALTHRFAGERRDAATGLDYLRARWMRPVWGGFASRDPWEGDVWEPPTRVAYPYAGLRPGELVDPTGRSFNDLSSAKVGLVIGGLIDGLASGIGYSDEKGEYAFDLTDAGTGILVGAVVGGVAGKMLGRIGRWLAGTEFGRGFLRAIAARGGARVGPKVAKQMGPRGWTLGAIDEAIKFGDQIKAINKATGTPATRYVHPQSGQSVVVDNVTGEVIHVGGPGFKYGPGSGDLP